MGCDSCVLQEPGGADLSLEQFCERLTACSTCERVEGTPELRVLVARQLESARVIRRLEQAARRQERRNQELEAEAVRYEERIDLLESMQKASLQETEAELRRKMELVEQQRQAILALSAPILRVGAVAVAVPLVGGIDGERAARLTGSLLDEILRSGALFAIVDLTGVDTIDTATAGHLLRLFQAVRLLGAEVVVSGVRGEVARCLVELGLDLDQVRIRRTLRDALRLCRGEGREARV